MSYSLAQLNEMNPEEFINALGAIFEASPWVAERTALKRPFSDIKSLHQAMVEVVKNSTPEEQLSLICAHPDLGSRVKMAEASVQEQASAGLNQLSPEEFERFQTLNQAYKEQFGFPFIIAVKQHTKTSILEAFEHRLQNSIEIEWETALQEIAKIALFRLQDQITSDAADELLNRKSEQFY